MTSVLAAPGLSQPASLREVGHQQQHTVRHAHPSGSHQHQQQHQQQQHYAYNGNGAAAQRPDSQLLHRPTSAPPDLELNTGNVFSFGLSSYNNHSIRQPLVDDTRPFSPSGAASNYGNAWASSSPTSTAARLKLASQQGPGPIGRNTSLQQQQHQSAADKSGDLTHQLQQAVEGLSLQDSARGPVASFYPTPSLAQPSSDLTHSSALPASADVNSYLYNLNLQQSLLSQLNLSSLSPHQLALLQQQMQRLSSPIPAPTAAPSTSSMSAALDEQQKQLLLLQQQQQHLLQQQQQAALLFHQQHGMHTQQYGRPSHTQQQRGYRGPGRDRDRDGGMMQQQQYGRRGGREQRDRDERGNGMHSRQNGKYAKNGGMGGFRSHESRGMSYSNGVYGEMQLSGEGKLLSPHRPLSPPHSFSHTSSTSTDASDDPYASVLSSQFTAASTVEELTGSIYVLAKDQYGCRLLQRLLDEQKPALVDLVFRECFEHINELMTDAFGNYLLQKLIEQCSEPQRIAIISKSSADLVAIALNMHGTRAVQKIVESVSSAAEVEQVVAALRSSVVTLIKDLNGNHVIQRCLHHLASSDSQFIYDAVSRHCVSVATHKHGCCVLQRCIDYATIAQKRQLVAEVQANALELVQDAFGNYVVQYVLDLNEQSVSAGIVTNLLGHISSLSVQKFSSNVVEKCLELTNDRLRARMIEELIHAERLPRLLQDPYANYVLQKALTVSKKAQFERLVLAIKPHLVTLKNTSFGKRIQSKIIRKFPHLGLTLDLDELGLGGAQQMQQLGGGGGGGGGMHGSNGGGVRGVGAGSGQQSLLAQQQQLVLQQLSAQQQQQQQQQQHLSSLQSLSDLSSLLAAQQQQQQQQAAGVPSYSQAAAGSLQSQLNGHAQQAYGSAALSGYGLHEQSMRH